MWAMRVDRAVAGLALLILALAGCADTGVKPEALKAWVGKPAAALEKDWGPATREVEDGELRILIYEEVEKRATRSFEDPGTTTAARYLGPTAIAHAAAQEAYRIPTVYVRSYLFWVDRQGTIVNSTVRLP
jgi:hypothetical protein